MSTPAPAWKTTGLRRLLLDERRRKLESAANTYLAAGAGGQNTWIVPGHDLVIVRMGHMRGQGAARRGTNEALGLVMQAIGAGK